AALVADPVSPAPVSPPSARPPEAIASVAEHPSRPVKRSPARWLLPAAAALGVVPLGFAVRGGGTRAPGALPFLAVGDIRTETSPDTTRLGPILRDMLAT